MALFSVNSSPTAISPSQKRNALYKSRGVSPTFKEILRDRCHIRIKSRRSSLIEQFRNMGNRDLRATLSNLLHEEVNDLKSDSVDPMDFEDHANMLDFLEEKDEDKWIIEEYERVLEEEEALFNLEWEKEVICPLCEKTVLRQESDCSIICRKCHVEFPKVPTLSYFKDCLDRALSNHAQDCNNIAQFAIVFDGFTDGLFLICHECAFFSQVV